MTDEKGPPEEDTYFSQNLNDDREQARQGLGRRTLQAEATECRGKGPQCSTNKEQQEGREAGVRRHTPREKSTFYAENLGKNVKIHFYMF